MNINKIKAYLLKNKMTILICTIDIILLIVLSLIFSVLVAALVTVLINAAGFFIYWRKFKMKKESKRVKNNKKSIDIKSKAKSLTNGFKKNNNSKNTKNSSINNKVKIVPEKNKGKKRKVLKVIITGILGFIILCILAFTIFCIIIVKDAPEFDPSNLYKSSSTILYDKDGEIIKKLGIEKRENITYDQVPEVLVDAIIATEDSRFFQHNGVDLLRFIKATVLQLTGRDAGGASTLTMQISKQNYTSNVATGFEGIKRKFTDIYMSVFKIEKKYSKQEIFEFYINANALGANSYGVEQACLTYFGKSAKDINLAEAALIAGLFQAPTAYNPYINPNDAEERRQQVLYLMERHGYITAEEREIASAITAKDLLKKEEKSGSVSQYSSYIDTVVEEVKNLTGENPYTTSMQIYTAMDRSKQEHIDNIMDGDGFKWENDYVNAGISVIDVKTGEIAAIGAGRNRSGESVYNTATMNKRQIGSTAKPLYDYGPGIEYNNWSTYQTFLDRPYTYSNGTPIYDYDNSYKGLLTSRAALSDSRNIPALKAFQSVDNSKIVEFVTKLGLSPEIESGRIHEAHSIGAYNGESALSMSAAYAAFANGGYYIEPHSIRKIVYRDTGEVLENKKEKVEVMGRDTAYMISDMLISTASHALGSYSKPNGLTICGKTGTTNFDSATKKAFGLGSNAINDLWVVGYDSEYSIAVWYGYNEINKKYYTHYGSQQHKKLFYATAKGIFKKGAKFEKPSNVVAVKVEKGHEEATLPSANTPSNMIITELFKKGTEPEKTSSKYATLSNVSSLSGTIIGSKVTLNWKGISDPGNSSLGSLIYQIYVKDSSGTKYIGSTPNTSYSFNYSDSSSSSVTFVVKSAYSLSDSYKSSGAEIKLNVPNREPEEKTYTSQLNGSKSLELNVGDAYTESGVTVLENGSSDVTKSANISVTMTGPNGAVNADSITLNAGTYTVTYSISYGSYSNTLTRTVIVK